MPKILVGLFLFYLIMTNKLDGYKQLAVATGERGPTGPDGEKRSNYTTPPSEYGADIVSKFFGISKGWL